jgi:hypothetical protein
VRVVPPKPARRALSASSFPQKLRRHPRVQQLLTISAEFSRAASTILRLF